MTDNTKNSLMWYAATMQPMKISMIAKFCHGPKNGSPFRSFNNPSKSRP